MDPYQERYEAMAEVAEVLNEKMLTFMNENERLLQTIESLEEALEINKMVMSQSLEAHNKQEQVYLVEVRKLKTKIARYEDGA